jgi:excisionase family DNA binding protein
MTSDGSLTLTLAEVAEMICGPDTSLKDPELWVRRKIAAGEFSAIKVGRTYRMTHEQVKEAIEALVVSRMAPRGPIGLTPTAARRRRTA